MSIIRYNNRFMTPGIFNFLSDVLGEDQVTSKTNNYTLPAVNVRETEKAFEIEMAVPGFDKKDIQVEVDKDVLTISSSREESKAEESGEVRRTEFSYGHFERSFNIPEDANTDAIKAKTENGILYVELPKKEEKVSVRKMIKVA